MKNVLLSILMLFFLSTVSYSWKPGDPIVDERDGQTYKTVIIGSQCWMAENLNIGTLIKSTKGGGIMKDDGVIEKYCWDDLTGNCDGTGGAMKRGGFYEWSEAMQYYGTTQPALPVQGICPKGWHIPSNTEWNTLINQTGGSLAYQQLLETGNSGFNALLTGYRCTMTGGFRVSATAADTRTYFWTAEQTDAQNVPLIEIGQGSISSFPFLKTLGLCVRCISDEIVGINENYFEKEFNLTIIPSPAKDEVTVTFNNYKGIISMHSIRITDLDGKLVKEYTDHNSINGINSIVLSVRNIASGKYILVIEIEGKQFTKTLEIIR
jgi:uncharacterized protein (TIGR02145 family)